MALKIRLTRLGDKGTPFYRVVVAESSVQRDGKVVAQIGTFDPKIKNDKDAIKIEITAAQEWLAKGATPTETARVVLEKAGVLEKAKPKKTTKPTTPKPAKKDKKEKK